MGGGSILFLFFWGRGGIFLEGQHLFFWGGEKKISPPRKIVWPSKKIPPPPKKNQNGPPQKKTHLFDPPGVTLIQLYYWGLPIAKVRPLSLSFHTALHTALYYMEKDILLLYCNCITEDCRLPRSAYFHFRFILPDILPYITRKKKLPPPKKNIFDPLKKSPLPPKKTKTNGSPPQKKPIYLTSRWYTHSTVFLRIADCQGPLTFTFVS